MEEHNFDAEAALVLLGPSSPRSSDVEPDDVPFAELAARIRNPSWMPMRFDPCACHALAVRGDNEVLLLGEEAPAPAPAPAELPSLVLHEALVGPGGEHRPLPGPGRSVLDLPDDILTMIFKTVSSFKELVCLMQTCRRFYRLCLPDEVWRSCAPDCALTSPINAKGCPRMWGYKNQVLSDRLTMEAFSTQPVVYLCMRDVMDVWWESCSVNWSKEEEGYFKHRRSTGDFDGFVSKHLDLSLVYQALDVIFTHRADCVASELLVEFGLRSEPGSLQGAEGGAVGHAITIKLWDAVLTQWRRYDQWLKLAVGNSRRLHNRIMAQRKSSVDWRVTVPTLHEKGSAHFRNQVVLRFGLRYPLQEGQKWLLQQDAAGSASPWETWLLDCISTLLKELDVPEDLGLYMRVKLIRCFVLENDAWSFTPAMS